ncbi:MAG: hypothetical protein IJ723_00940 [Ruminococcus sp.]|nr:hypothetical protein [Ruminococcus sp.]
MTEREIKRNLNRPVRFTNPKLYAEGKLYKLTGATIRRGDEGFYYQAELLDMTTENSVLIVRLEEIEEVPDDQP